MSDSEDSDFFVDESPKKKAPKKPAGEKKAPSKSKEPKEKKEKIGVLQRLLIPISDIGYKKFSF